MTPIRTSSGILFATLLAAASNGCGASDPGHSGGQLEVTDAGSDALPTDVKAESPVEALDGGFRSVRLTSFGYWGGSFEWEATRDRMSAEQIAAFSAMKPRKSTSACAADNLQYSIVVVDSKGTERKFVANDVNGNCGSATEVLDFDSVKPVLATLKCVGTGSAGAELSTAKTISPNDGCKHGFFARKVDDPPVWVKVAATQAGRAHTFEVRSCAGKATTLELFDESGGTRLAEISADGTEGAACAKLVHALEAKTYALRVTTRPVSVGGHVLLEVTSK